MDWLIRLKEMKQASGLTTKQIAEGSGIPEPTLEKLFAGATKEPKLPTMQHLVHFLGYTLDDLTLAKPKKAPAPAEPETGGLADSKTASFYRLLIREGYLMEGEDFTDAQVEILQGVLQILNAAFPRRKAPESSKSRKVG